MRLIVAALSVSLCLPVLTSAIAQDAGGPTTQPSHPRPGWHRGAGESGEALSPEQMRQRCREMMQHRRQMVQQMRQMDQQLEQKVQVMNQAPDLDQKVQAMQQVIDLLVQQRTQAHQKMLQMHRRMGAHMMEHMRCGMAECPALGAQDQGGGEQSGAESPE